LFTRSDWSYELSGANVFDNIRWFNKERTEENLATLFLIMLLTAKTARVEEVKKLYKTICAAKLKAAYKCELFIKPFMPPEKTKKAETKKTAAKKASSKTASAKNGAKSGKKASKKETVSKAGTKTVSKKK